MIADRLYFTGVEAADRLLVEDPFALLIGLGLIFYASGARTRAQRVELPLVDETRTATATS